MLKCEICKERKSVQIEENVMKDSLDAKYILVYENFTLKPDTQCLLSQVHPSHVQDLADYCQ